MQYDCNRAGYPKLYSNINISPSKRRKRAESIKVGCNSKILIQKLTDHPIVVIKYYWKHEGHSPGSINDLALNRTSTELKEWIKNKIDEGFDWYSMKQFLRRDEDQLVKVTLIFYFNYLMNIKFIL